MSTEFHCVDTNDKTVIIISLRFSSYPSGSPVVLIGFYYSNGSNTNSKQGVQPKIIIMIFGTTIDKASKHMLNQWYNRQEFDTPMRYVFDVGRDNYTKTFV